MGAGRILLSTLSNPTFYDPGLESIDAGNNATGLVNLVSRQAARTPHKKRALRGDEGLKNKTNTIG
jgi:hypothetical protein